MKLFCTSQTHTRMEGDRQFLVCQMLYLGTDKAEAIRLAKSVAPAVLNRPPSNFPELYCALPSTVERTVLRYHNRDTCWVSIVEFYIEEDTCPTNQSA